MRQGRRVRDQAGHQRGACPRCGARMERVTHEIGGAVTAWPCGCPVRYWIDGDVVTVTNDRRKGKAA